MKNVLSLLVMSILFLHWYQGYSLRKEISAKFWKDKIILEFQKKDEKREIKIKEIKKIFEKNNISNINKAPKEIKQFFLGKGNKSNIVFINNSNRIINQFVNDNGEYVTEYIGTNGDFKKAIVDTGDNLFYTLECVINKNQDNFLYQYKLIIGTNSKYNLSRFIVEVPYKIIQDSYFPKPENNWLITKKNKTKIIKGRSMFLWSSIEYQNNNSEVQKKSIDGFGLLSQGYPGIVECYANGKTSYSGLELEMPPSEAVTWSSILGPGYVPSKTLGSVKLPWDDNPILTSDKVSAMCDRLTNYIAVSFDEGWIEDTKIRDWLKGKLGEIKAQEGSGDKSKAKAALEEILTFIEPYKDKDKGILTEAYGLLKYNLEYVRDELLK